MNNPQRQLKEGLTAREQARLGQALARREQAPAVAPEIDSRILQRARLHFEGTAAAAKPRRFIWVRLAWATGLAGALAIAILMLASRLHESVRPQPAGPNLRGDLDQNGRVDILDALALARQIESGENGPTDGDINGDGAVDEQDVRGIAMQSVLLSSREGG